MSTTLQLSQHLHQVYFGGNWTTVNVKDVVSAIPFDRAVAKVEGFNSIASLAYHINYYLHHIAEVLEGGDLTANDAYSYDMKPITSEEEWHAFKEGLWRDGIRLSERIRELPDSVLPSWFTDEKYGTYHRNLLGVIEHTHYHLGQIVILNTMLQRYSGAEA